MFQICWTALHLQAARYLQFRYQGDIRQLVQSVTPHDFYLIDQMFY